LLDLHRKISNNASGTIFVNNCVVCCGSGNNAHTPFLLFAASVCLQRTFGQHVYVIWKRGHWFAAHALQAALRQQQLAGQSRLLQMKYLTKRGLDGLKAYQYKASGYTYLDNLHRPFLDCE
jgi:hypothetical protein